ncbi:hypothetical protein ES707_06069 [subsurface metagenome]
MERATAFVDILAVWSIVHHDDFAVQPTKNLGSDFRNRAIGAINDHFESGKIYSLRDAFLYKLNILLFCLLERNDTAFLFFFSIRKFRCFQFLFYLALQFVGKLHSRIGEEFYPIILVWVMGGGNNNTCKRVCSLG